MGCDIHLYVEKKQGTEWVPVDRWFVDPDSEDDPELITDYRKSFYYDRNYQLFAILADVRNGFGFAGIVTGEALVPIDEPRGLPEDVSQVVKACSDRWGVDGHSHSHFTVAELMAYDWTQVASRRGYIPLSQHIEWSRYDRRHGYGPRSHCGDVGGGNIHKVTMDEGDVLLAKAYEQGYGNIRGDAERYEFLKKMNQGKDVYVNVTWEEPYYRAANTFLQETLPRLWAVGAPDDVRIVFWFDN